MQISHARRAGNSRKQQQHTPHNPSPYLDANQLADEASHDANRYASHGCDLASVAREPDRANEAQIEQTTQITITTHASSTTWASPWP
jgi:hypothetical protein